MERQILINRFEFITNKETRGLTAEILWDLRDICHKFGKVNLPDRSTVRFHSGDIGQYFEISISSSPDERNTNMVVFKYPKETIPNLQILVTRTHTPITTRTGLVLWPSTLTGIEASKAIEEIDKKYQARGFVNPQTRERRVPPPEDRLDQIGATVYKVDEVFNDPHTTWVISTPEEAEFFLSRFDQPEKLEYIHDETGMGFLQLKGAQEEFEIVQDTLMPTLEELLREKGYSDLSEVPWSEIATLREELQERISRKIQS